MALQKQISLPNGTTGNYWRIDRYSINRSSGIVSVNFFCYKDYSFREENLVFGLDMNTQYGLKIDEHSEEFNLTEEEITSPDILEIIYGKAKERIFFENATDI